MKTPPDRAGRVASTTAVPGGDAGASAKHADMKRTPVHRSKENQNADDADPGLVSGTSMSFVHQATSKTTHPGQVTGAVTVSLPPWPAFDPFEEAARRAEARGRIDQSQLTLSEPRRERNPEHLKRVASRPCLVCGRNRSQAHHLTYLQPRAMGRKVSDEFTVPLCSTHHRELHASGNERAWWEQQGIDPAPVARELWQESRKRSETASLAGPPDHDTLNSATAAGDRDATNGASADRLSDVAVTAPAV